MSYILDALKKAAEQRDAHAPAMRRLFSPAPEFSDSPPWRLALVGGAAAVAGAVIAVWVLWPAPPVVTEKLAASSTTARIQPEIPRVQGETPRVQPETPPTVQPAPPVVRSAPKPPAPVKAAAEKRPAPVEPAVPVRQAPGESVPTAPPPPVQAPAESSPAQTRQAAAQSVPAPTVPMRQPPIESGPVRPQPATPPPVIAAVRPTPAAVPPTASAPSRADGGGQMRLEVIVYSEERARRLAFINGRKYVEGDVLLDGSRIQEIQPNAVVIIDDGRRVVLKP